MKVDAELVRESRLARGWSQEQLAAASELDLRTIQRIETTASASLRSKKALAAALDLDIQDLDNKESTMSPCPECRSDQVFQFDGLVDSTTIGGQLLPGLASSKFYSAKMLAVVCGDCGFVRWFIDEEAREKLKASKHWNLVKGA